MGSGSGSYIYYKVILISILFTVTKAASCPCNNVTFCDNIKANYSKELYGFLGGSNSSHNDTGIYNWTYLTALAVKGDWTNEAGMDELMCTAHSHGVRLIYWQFPNMPLTSNTDAQMIWIKELFGNVTSLNYDGYTFDYEGEMLWNSPQSQYYVNLVNMTTQYFHQNLPGSTISICVPFSAYLEWGRQYDYFDLAQVSDYLYIMDYDINTQIFDSQCIARANSPYLTTQRGVQSYLNLKIDPSKLILGIPWYGKQYPCIVDEMDAGATSKFCPIPIKDARGVNCSDSVAQEVSYSVIMNRIYVQKWNITEIRWDDTEKAPYCNVYGHKESNNLLQYWWDNPQSLIWKYQYAKTMGLRGLGPFQFGDLVFDESDDEKQRAQQMWTAFDTFYL